MFNDVSVIIPYRDGLSPHRRLNASFIEHHLHEALPGAEIVRADDPDPDAFNRGRAVNNGVAATARPVLLIADGDVWLPKHALKEGIERVRRGGISYVIPFTKIIWCKEEWSEKVLHGLQHISSRPHRSDVLLEWGGKSTGICNVVSRESFEKIGGFDPRFHGWGFEDCAWDLAATTLAGPKARLNYEGRHLYHPSCESKNNAEQIAIGQVLHQQYKDAEGNREAMLALIAAR